MLGDTVVVTEDIVAVENIKEFVEELTGKEEETMVPDSSIFSHKELVLISGVLQDIVWWGLKDEVFCVRNFDDGGETIEQDAVTVREDLAHWYLVESKTNDVE